MVLVDFEGPVNSVTVDVTQTSLDPSQTFATLPFFIGGFPPSPTPPDISDGSGLVGVGALWDIPAGDYSSTPFEIPLGGIAPGGACYLFQTQSSTDLGAAFISFTVNATSVPEPPGLVLAFLATLICLTCRFIRHRASA
jgi:hypothetical protein